MDNTKKVLIVLWVASFMSFAGAIVGHLWDAETMVTVSWSCTVIFLAVLASVALVREAWPKR